MAGINKKSIFALFAVTLMVFSACAALAICVMPTTADSDNETKCTTPISINYDGSKWVMDLPKELESCITLDETNGILTLNNAEFRVESSSDAAVKIDGGTEVKNFKIKYDGINTVINHPTESTNGNVYGIKTTNVALTIEGNEGIATALLIATEKDSTSFNNSIGIGNNENQISSCTFVEASVSIIPCDATNAIGICEQGNVIVKDFSNVAIFSTDEQKKITYSKYVIGIECSNLKIENHSEVSMEAKANQRMTGVSTIETFEMIGSSIEIKSNDISKGIITGSNPINIDNSTIAISVTNNAVSSVDSDENPIKWDVSAFKNMTLKGCPSGGEPATITGTTIPLEYGILNGEPNKMYTVTFDLNGATSGTAPTVPPVGEGLTITLPSTDAKKDGYTFAGWKCSLDDKVYLSGQTSPAITNDVTFTAEWKQNSSGSGNDNTTLIISIVLAIIILVGCGTYAYFKKFKQ